MNSNDNQNRAQGKNTQQQSRTILDMLAELASSVATEVGKGLSGAWNRIINGPPEQDRHTMYWKVVSDKPRYKYHAPALPPRREPDWDTMYWKVVPGMQEQVTLPGSIPEEALRRRAQRKK